jgi:hypothetical protein
VQKFWLRRAAEHRLKMASNVHALYP